jgi:CheY-like chemotaxis protein
MTVWVVDDDLYILKLFGFMLRRNGVENRLFESCEKAIAAAETDLPDMLFTDIHLPGLNGTDLAKTLRSAHPDSNLRIIGLTTEPETLTQDFDGHLSKPVDEDQMLAMIRKTHIDLPFLDAMIHSEDDRREILQHFTEETAADVRSLSSSLLDGDREKLILLVHRLAGRLAQFSQSQLSGSMREIEQQLLNGASDEIVRLPIEMAISGIRKFLRKTAMYS